MVCLVKKITGMSGRSCDSIPPGAAGLLPYKSRSPDGWSYRRRPQGRLCHIWRFVEYGEASYLVIMPNMTICHCCLNRTPHLSFRLYLDQSVSCTLDHPQPLLGALVAVWFQPPSNGCRDRRCQLAPHCHREKSVTGNRKGAGAMSTTKVKVLVISDSPTKILAGNSVISDRHYAFTSATSVREALGLLLKVEFALILLEVRPPESDGMETAALI